MQQQRDIKSPVGLKVSLGSAYPATLYPNPVYSQKQWQTSALDPRKQVLKSIVMPNAKEESQWDYNYILANRATPQSNSSSNIISIGQLELE